MKFSLVILLLAAFTSAQSTDDSLNFPAEVLKHYDDVIVNNKTGYYDTLGLNNTVVIFDWNQTYYLVDPGTGFLVEGGTVKNNTYLTKRGQTYCSNSAYSQKLAGCTSCSKFLGYKSAHNCKNGGGKGYSCLTKCKTCKDKTCCDQWCGSAKAAASNNMEAGGCSSSQCYGGHNGHDEL